MFDMMYGPNGRGTIESLQRVWRSCHGPSITQRVPLVGDLIRLPFWLYQQVSPAHRRQARYEREHPDAPWLVPDAITRLDDLIQPDWSAFEWGSGGSTPWLGTRLTCLHSVEHNVEWYARVATACRDLPNVRFIYAEVSSPAHVVELHHYVNAIDAFPDQSLDLVLIDGEFRLDCLAHALPKIKDCGVLVLDNFEASCYRALRDTMSKDLRAFDGCELYDNGIWQTALFTLTSMQRTVFTWAIHNART